MKPNLRQSNRVASAIDGVIYNLEGSPLSLCVVRDVSASGAKLQLPEDYAVPRFFLLGLSYDAGEKHLCTKIWQLEGLAGIRFSNSREAQARPPNP